MQAFAAIGRRAARALVAVLVGTSLFGAPLAAQQLRGTVRDSTSGAGIPGAVLLLLDSSNVVIGRNLTNERGEYAIALSPAMRTLRVLRIGFRPRERRIPEPVGGVARLDVTMPSIPTLLAPVEVVDQPNCPRRPDRSTAFALWEQAQTALLATVVAREANPARMLLLRFDRRLAGLTDSVTALFVRADSMSTTRPFASVRTAEEFVEHGFVDDSAGFNVFHGPDAEVLLDPAFVRGYCLELAPPDPARATEIGLAFRAARAKRGRIDIAGTVWMDTASRALTDIVFRYAGLDRRLDPARLGGRISFRAMSNGSVIIDRWFIRPVNGLTVDAEPRRDARLRDVVEIREVGGEVAAARWPDGQAWTASLGILKGRAMYDTVPAANVRLSLVDTDYGAVTDSLGNFEISHLVPGPYQIGVLDPVVAELDLSLGTGIAVRAARDSTVRIVFNTPTAHSLALTLCQTLESETGTHAILARAVASSGLPASGASFQAEMLHPSQGLKTRRGRANDGGLFALCGIEPSTSWTLIANHDSEEAVARLVVERPVEVVRLRLNRRRR